MELGILFEPGVLCFARFFTNKAYVLRSKYVDSGILGSPLSSNINPIKSCHGYCLTLHVHVVVYLLMVTVLDCGCVS